MRQTAPLPFRAVAGLAAALILAGPAAAENAGAPTADPTQVRPGAYRLDPAHGKITWSVSHLGYSTYYGQITDVAAQAQLDPKEPGKSRITVTIGIDSVNGLNDKLNQHLKTPDFFDAAKFPTATFTSTSVEPTSPTTARVNGDLTLRGVTKPVSFDATFNQAGISPVDKTYTVGFDGRTVLKRSDFGINAFLPVLGDEVSLRLEGEFKAVE
ncbi:MULTISPECIES: YceI family protein [Methylobacterium]|uniref:YceI family protein n=1 Tax=Methylobacterium TaxID=407 RepID=UPI0010484886|nr:MULTISPECIES: YceI family protein [Methylobacterium]MDR7040017.1 polyisoprenoid-binding protein YceI [Methylobacterium sp. BE186]